MGRDYLIHVYLEIQHTNGIAYYELPTIGGYYTGFDCGVYDSDEEEEDYYYNTQQCKELYQKYIDMCLTPRKPLVLYKNGEFLSDHLKQKYLPMIQNKLKRVYMEEYCVCEDIGELKDICDIFQITKKEIRYEMGEGPGMYRSDGRPFSEDDSDDDEDEN